MNFNVPNQYQITSNKTSCKTSTKKTRNQYDKSQTVTSFLDCLHHGQLLEANLWGIELMVSGFGNLFWEAVINDYFNTINYINFHLIAYIDQQFNLWNEIKKSYAGHLWNLCNNQEIRNHVAEMISLLCLTPRIQLSIPEKITSRSAATVDATIVTKSTRFVTLFLKNMSSQSVVYQHFYQLVISYYCNQWDCCLSYINWFVRDENYAVDIDLDFKLPPQLAHKIVVLLLKFFLLQIRTQVPAIQLETVTNLLNTTINYYISAYKKHDLTVCVSIMAYFLFLSRNLETLENPPPVDPSDYQIIRQCLEINLLYQQINSQSKTEPPTSSPTTSNKRPTKARKQKSTTSGFYENPRNQEYLRLINDQQLFLCASTQIAKNQRTTPTADATTNSANTVNTIFPGEIVCIDNKWGENDEGRNDGDDGDEGDVDGGCSCDDDGHSFEIDLCE